MAMNPEYVRCIMNLGRYVENLAHAGCTRAKTEAVFANVTAGITSENHHVVRDLMNACKNSANNVGHDLVLADAYTILAHELRVLSSFY